MTFYSKKMGVWSSSQTKWDSFQNQSLMQKNLRFIVSRTLTCACMPVYAYTCIKHAHACPCMRMHALSMRMQSLSMRAHTRVCVHMPYGFRDLSFPKIAYLVHKRVRVCLVNVFSL